MHDTEFFQYKYRILILGGDCTGHFIKSVFSEFIQWTEKEIIREKWISKELSENNEY